LPQIMARHGAKLWVGFMTRAPGVRAIGGPLSGVSQVLGTRWKLDRAKDKITFHFERDGSFSYSHKFSEWVKYEELFGYRWRGRFFDYVYTRMPITTVSSLAFVVVRVPKRIGLIKEPIYKESHLAGMVQVTSVRAVGGCLGGKTPKFEPVKFELEAIVFDRMLETRLALGDRGNLATTIAYMRSARVRLAVNGVALGAVVQVPVEVLEPTAVAVEVLASDWKRSGDRDYSAIMRVAASDASFMRILHYFTGLKRIVGDGANSVVDRVRVALMAVLNGTCPIVVKAERCSPYVKVSSGDGVGEVKVTPELAVNGCGCAELSSVNSALCMANALSKQEKVELLAYAERLKAMVALCVVHDVHKVPEKEADDQYFDAADSFSVVEEDSAGSATENTSSGSTGGMSSTESKQSPDTPPTTASSFEHEACARLSDGESVVSEREDGESDYVAAMREYAVWAQSSDRSARSEAKLNSDVLFLQGNPTEADIKRSTTAKTRHAIVAVIGGKVTNVVGTLRDEDDFAEVYVRTLGRTCKVFQDYTGQKYIKEPVTELCYTSSGLRVMNGDLLARAALNALQDLPRGFRLPRYTFVDGVPGCGKTFEIKQEIKKMVGEGKSVLYLSSTKASVEAVKKELEGDLGKGAFVAMTYDAYVINGATPVGNGTFDMLFGDEAPMSHKGELWVALVKSCAVDAKFYGDSKQIPWLPFMATFDARNYAFSGDEVIVEYRHKTHRFGARTCAMWLDVYGMIFPCDCCEHADVLPEVRHITSYAGVPECKKGKVLVFTQEEKVTSKREGGFTQTLDKLKKLDKGGLSTVAEDQGGTHDEVFVVRLVNKKNPKESRQSPSIYNRQPWVLVATTRHRGKLVYYTTAADDAVVARIALASCNVRVEAVLKHAHWDTVRERALHVREFGV